MKKMSRYVQPVQEEPDTPSEKEIQDPAGGPVHDNLHDW